MHNFFTTHHFILPLIPILTAVCVLLLPLNYNIKTKKKMTIEQINKRIDVKYEQIEQLTAKLRQETNFDQYGNSNSEFTRLVNLQIEKVEAEIEQLVEQKHNHKDYCIKF